VVASLPPPREDPPAPVRDEPPEKTDIVVTGRRGSVVGDVAPIATFDPATLGALGATDIKTLLERLKPLAMSASGANRRSC
jgi:hypothetical protein